MNFDEHIEEVLTMLFRKVSMNVKNKLKLHNVALGKAGASVLNTIKEVVYRVGVNSVTGVKVIFFQDDRMFVTMTSLPINISKGIYYTLSDYSCLKITDFLTQVYLKDIIEQIRSLNVCDKISYSRKLEGKNYIKFEDSENIFVKFSFESILLGVPFNKVSDKDFENKLLNDVNLLTHSEEFNTNILDCIYDKDSKFMIFGDSIKKAVSDGLQQKFIFIQKPSQAGTSLGRWEGSSDFDKSRFKGLDFVCGEGYFVKLQNSYNGLSGVIFYDGKILSFDTTKAILSLFKNAA